MNCEYLSGSSAAMRSSDCQKSLSCCCAAGSFAISPAASSSEETSLKASIIMEALDRSLKRLVIEHKFEFTVIAAELGMKEQEVRERWATIHLNRKHPQLSNAPGLPVKPRKSPLDTSNVDFSKEKTMSVTGEEITPSRFCVLKHSLKDTFEQIRSRVKEFLPEVESEDENGEEITHYKVSFRDGNAVLETSHDQEQ